MVRSMRDYSSGNPAQYKGTARLEPRNQGVLATPKALSVGYRAVSFIPQI